jgi:PAT family beta-lactamase induction signal transducer AmpG
LTIKVRRVGVQGPLGFGSGLPYLLTGGTLTIWMSTAGIDLKTIGIFSLVGLPYNFKFLWAPLLDRFRLPFLGRRRGWILLTQLLLLVAIGVMGSLDPRSGSTYLAAMAVAVAFFSASQDIVGDAYRADILEGEGELGVGAGVFVTGYRVALIVSGAGALMLSEWLHWWAIYMIMAGLMLVGMIGTVIAPELRPEKTPGAPVSLREAVIEPLREFFNRDSAMAIMLIIAFFKVGESLLGHMSGPFLERELHFTPLEIGAVSKAFGLSATITGGLLGGGLVVKLGIRWSLIIFGVMQATTNLFYVALAVVGKSYSLLVAAVAVDNFCGGLATTAFVAFLMSLCNKRFTATQYALFTSLSSIIGRLLAAPSGWLVEEIGWSLYFGLTILFAIPALVLLAKHRGLLNTVNS